MVFTRVLALVLGWVAMPAFAQVQTLAVQWGDAQRFEAERTVAPGGRLEACAPLAKGQAVDWTFHADGVLAFQVFHRIGLREMVSDRRQRTRSLQGQMRAEEGMTYCWAWTNRGTRSVRLALMLRH